MTATTTAPPDEHGPSGAEQLRPIADMLSRVALARLDSESAAFDDLVALGELTVKLAVLGLTAGIRQEYRSQQYAIEYELVRADSIGKYESALKEIVNGETRRGLDKAAQQVQAELNTPVDRTSSTWQATALDALVEACSCLGMDVNTRGKLVGRRWFELMPQVRNRVRHSAPTISRKAATIDPLERSIRAVVDGLSLFRRPWFYARRQISGRVIALPLARGVSVPGSIDSLHSLTEGIYIQFDHPRRVPLIETDETLRDVWVPNGAYAAGRYELISYVSDSRRSGEGAHYQNPPVSLPESETQGLGQLEPEGQSFTNLPPLPRGYVDRRELETHLHDLLCDDRHPVITLHGVGGVGKTSLALSVLHQLTRSDRFAASIWFSARDVDLTPSGPKAVRPHLVTIAQIADEVVRLMEPGERTAKGFGSTAYCSGLLETGMAGAPLLFTFDNFETVAQPAEVFRWLDTYVRLPNKVLITTRQRAFKADYPLEVRGMTHEEFVTLTARVASQLGISQVLTPQLQDELFEESGGSPYIAKVLLGEMAIPGTRTRRPKRLVASRSDILDALFDRTFAAMHPEAQRVFLALSTCGELPLVALEAVLIRPEAPSVDVDGSLEPLLSGALVEIDDAAGDDEVYVATPTTAAAFGRRRLRVSPLRAVVEGDAALLRLFGPRTRRRAIDEQFERFARTAADEVRKGASSLDRYLPILEAAARMRPKLWWLVADLHDAFGSGWRAADQAAEAMRNYLEYHADDGDAWQRLAGIYELAGDAFAEVSALVERAELPLTPFSDVSYAASRLLAALAEGEGEGYGQSARDWLIERLIGVLQRRAAEADATDCSRVAWLYLHEGEEERARDWVIRGLSKEPDNVHCIRLQQRLRRPGRGIREIPETTVQEAPLERQSSDNAVDAIIDRHRIPSGTPLTVAAVENAVRELIADVATDPRYARELRDVGVPFARLGLILNRAIPDLEPAALGFRNLSQLTNHALKGSPFALIIVDSHPRLVFEEHAGTAPQLAGGTPTGTHRTVPKSTVPRRLGSIVERCGSAEDPKDFDVVADQVVGVVNALNEDRQCREQIHSAGLSFALVANVIGDALPALRPLRYGFRNISALVQQCLRGTRFTLAQRIGESPPVLQLIAREAMPAGMVETPLRPAIESHSIDAYLRFLGSGFPIIKPPPPADLVAVVGAAYDLPNGPRLLGSWIHETTQHLAGRLPQERVKAGLLCLVAADAFARTPLGTQLSEQDLVLREEYPSPEAALARIRECAQEKLARLLGDVRVDVLDDILPATPY